MAGFKFLETDNHIINARIGWFFLTVFFALLVPEGVLAKIADGLPCSDCHIMHNSQDGVSMVASGVAGEGLLNSSCIGCHTGTNSGTSMSNNEPPYVFYEAPTIPTYDPTCTTCDTLAGGNFYWVATGTDRKGHNVDIPGISDDVLFGASGTEFVPGTSGNMANQLTCAGVDGCHGNGSGIDIDSLMPAHHVIDDSTVGDSVANSFRFLSGIIGFEDTDWEYTVSPTDNHNQYKGIIGGGAGTMTSFCVSCHGDFHDGDVSSPFLRHPTDVSMPGSGEYDVYDSYNPISPVASIDISAILSDAQPPNNRIVSCISCHRAHGTPYDAILRWDYKAWPAGGYNGCAECHSIKN
jgi:hypothetical protein